MDATQRIIMTHKLKLLDELLLRTNLVDFSSPENGGGADYMTDPNCQEPDSYALKLAELLNLVGIQLLNSFTELRAGFESAASSSEDGPSSLINSSSSIPLFT